MSRRDSYHYAVKRALVKDGWTVTNLPVCDPVHDEYLLISLGWHHEDREHDIVFHAQFRDGKVLILDDRTEEGIAPFLIEAGIEDSDIEVAWASRRRTDNSAALAA